LEEQVDEKEHELEEMGDPLFPPSPFLPFSPCPCLPLPSPLSVYPSFKIEMSLGTSLQSIKTFHAQQQKLFDEFCKLRVIYVIYVYIYI
jgi:hypothetical protein